jgi:hypothetical protein
MFDIELTGIARITVEKKIHQVDGKDIFAATIAIYDKLINTSYFQNQEDVFEHVESTKILIQVMCQ